jgi:RimJ/RimL family protein N-acetyltransferase
MIGRGGLQWTTYVRDLDEVEVGWSVIPERWRQGLATELALASIDVAFGPLDLDQVVAFTLPDNVASRRVMEKAGFSYDRDILHVGLSHVLYRVRRAR